MKVLIYIIRRYFMTTKTQRLTKTAVIAALYVVATIAIAPMGYGNIQFRISELLVLLALFDPMYIGGLTLGCVIANLLGPNGPLDVILGSFASFISLCAIYYTGKVVKNEKKALLIASIWPVIFNAIIISWMLKLTANLPMALSMLEVGLSELIIVTIIGVPVVSLLKPYINKVLVTR